MGKPRVPWLKLSRKSQVELPERPPIWLRARSNGEYFHPQSPEEAKIERLVMERADEQARRLGMDRREFLASSMGMFTTLAVINQVGGCGGDNGDGTMNINPADVTGMTPTGGRAGADMAFGGAGVGGGPGMVAMPGGNGVAGGDPFAMPGGSSAAGAPGASGAMAAGGSGGGSGGVGSCPYVVPVDATCEETGLLDGSEFIADVQTHSFDDGEWRTSNGTYANFLGFIAPCTDAAMRLDCFNEDHYGTYMFLESDTTVAVITSWPAQLCTEDVTTACGLPLSNPGMRDLRESINQKLKSQRVVNQVQVMPNDRWELQRDVMTMSVEDPAWHAVSWKAYPAWGPAPSGIGGMGYFLTSEVGRMFVEHGLSLGIPNFAIHKGLPIPGFDVEHNQPVEIGEIAKAYPEANFVIYHSGIGAGTSSLLGVGSGEVAFDESITDPLMHTGTNQLIAALRQQGIDAANNTNVYAEMGSAWSNVMNNPTAAQHYVGKMLKYVGEDHVVWGTDCILYGSPQPQIEAFRMFQITPEMQQQYGYPALTDAIKAKIFGLNAARVLCLDPAARRCAATDGAFARLRRARDAELGTRRWAFQEPLGPRTRREFLQMARLTIAKNRPGA